MKIKQTIKALVEKPRISEYEKRLASMRGSYEEWIVREEKETIAEILLSPREGQNRGNSVSGDEVGIHTEEALILYGDEDLMDANGRRHSPWFRPDWSPELLESCFYLGSVIGVRKSFLEKEVPDWQEKLGKYEISPEIPAIASGEWVFLCNESPEQAYQSFIRELCKKAGGWDKGCRSIVHVPVIMHHCAAPNGFAVFEAFAPIKPEDGRTTISVIIPSKDNPELLISCIHALKRAWNSDITEDGDPDNIDGDEPGMARKDAERISEGLTGIAKSAEKQGSRGNLEILVVDNGSREENRARIAELAETEGIRYFYQPMEFDFAKMCNMGAREAKGELLLFLNDDVELLPESQLDQMAALAQRPGVGTVGIKLRYPNSTKLQHAGITNLPMGPVHKLQFLDDAESHYHGLNRGNRNVLAVTAACVMLKADRFWEAGGFDESLKVAFNDVALCFRLYELGYRNVCMCDAYAFHHESLTRGGDDSQEKLERLLKERDRLYQTFPKLVGKDPYYSKHLGSRGLDVRVRPAYVTMKNCLQKAVVSKAGELSRYREDACLMFRIEDERDGEITGYIVVLGDDNACYDKKLLLQNEAGEIHAVSLDPTYRPDLEENLLDQVHVALSGFWICLDKAALPKGHYRIGCAVKRAVGRVCLVGWSNRFLQY